MGYPTPRRHQPADFGFDVVGSKIKNVTIVQKFGHAHAVTTSFNPVCVGNVFPTPQVSGATTLRVKAGGNAQDEETGTGARELTLEGLDGTGAPLTEVLVTNGVSASVSTAASFLRLFRVTISKSGTYASATAGSHVADIVIEDTAGTEDWCTLSVAGGFPAGQSQIGAYTVPLGYEACVAELAIDVDSTKSVDVVLFKRENILETAAPYSSMSIVKEFIGLSGSTTQDLKFPIMFPTLTDIGFMAKVASGTAEVSVAFTIVLFEQAD